MLVDYNTVEAGQPGVIGDAHRIDKAKDIAAIVDNISSLSTATWQYELAQSINEQRAAAPDLYLTEMINKLPPASKGIVRGHGGVGRFHLLHGL